MYVLLYLCFLRRRFILTKQIYKKNHTYNTKHTIYNKKEKKGKKETRSIKRRERNWGSHYVTQTIERNNRSSCSAYILFMQSTR